MTAYMTWWIYRRKRESKKKELPLPTPEIVTPPGSNQLKALLENRKRKADNISKTGKAKKKKAAKPKKEKKDPQKEASECVDSEEFAQKQEKIYQDFRQEYINAQYARDERDGRQVYAQIF